MDFASISVSQFHAALRKRVAQTEPVGTRSILVLYPLSVTRFTDDTGRYRWSGRPLHVVGDSTYFELANEVLSTEPVSLGRLA